jgi:hypothetical protein
MRKPIILNFLILNFLIISACANRSEEKKTDSDPKETTANPEMKLDLDDLQRRTFNYFWETTDTVNWQCLDRYPTLNFSSIASTGFGLTSYIVGAERKFITREQAAERVLKTLQVLQKLPQGPAKTGVSGYKGLFYHFLTLDKALRFQEVELSTIDTGLLMAGVLSVMSYFDQDNETEQQIRTIADFLYRRVEWDWAMQDSATMSMGYHPERGFLQEARWRGYNEAMVLLIMAMASPTHPIPASAWQAWTRTYQWGTYFGQEHVNFGPLFGHQYSHMYIDFRGIQDSFMRSKGIDYFENSRRATYANRSYCIANPAGYVGYSNKVWGLTACDGPGNANKANPNIAFMGYSARGAAQWHVTDDGTIAPTAAGGSVPFAPEICLPALDAMYQKYGNRIYKEYGFIDAFNLTIVHKDGRTGWYDPDYIGIDQGPILIQIENHRSGLIWNIMKKNKYIVAGLKKAGFTGGWLNGEGER